MIGVRVAIVRWLIHRLNDLADMCDDVADRLDDTLPWAEAITGYHGPAANIRHTVAPGFTTVDLDPVCNPHARNLAGTCVTCGHRVVEFTEDVPDNVRPIVGTVAANRWSE